MFELISQINNRRVGKLHTKSGVIETPFFMPIATKGAVKNVSPEDLRELGAQIVLGNTYHLWLRPGDELIARAGGLHKFMNWDGPILTDSGGYQVFSLGERAKDKYGTSGVRLTEEGVEFVDPTNGSKHFMSPEKSIEIQLNLGSDMIMVLDECPPYPCSHKDAKKSLELTTRWAERCLSYFKDKTNHLPKEKRPLLFAIVQGSIYEDLRKESAKQLTAMDFDGFAIGGVAVGEPRKHLYEILDWVVPLLPADKPRYLMGLGKPEELARAVEAGMDMFDCVIPTREGRHGRLFIWNKQSEFPIFNFSAQGGPASGWQFPNNDQNPNDQISKQIQNPVKGRGPNGTLRPKSEIQNKTGNLRDVPCSMLHDKFYETININNEQFKEDFSPIDAHCNCYTCKNFTKAYLNHLLRTDEPFFLKLASVHNLYFYHRLMEFLRDH